MHPEDQVIEHPLLFWLLWSAKEATFKYDREPLNFAPTKIPIQIKKERNIFHFSSKSKIGQYYITENYVLAIAGDPSKINFQLFDDDHPNWENGIRFMLIDNFREQGYDYHIGSDELNLPIVKPGNHPISVSHHGRFAVAAFPKTMSEIT